MTLRLRRWLLAVGMVLAGLLGVVPGASAHASLQESSPVDGAEVAESPARVTLSFNEPVRAPTGGIRVHAPDGGRVDDGAPFSVDDDTIGVALRPDLDVGTYVVTWRAVSEDGHTIRGAFVFGVGDAAVADEALLRRLFAGDGEAFVAAAAGVVRGAGSAAVLVAAGAAIFAAAVARSQHDRSRAARWIRRGGVVGLAAALLAVPLQAMQTTGFGPVGALRPDVIADTLGTAFGASVALRVVSLGALVALAWRDDSDRATTTVGMAAAAAALASFVVEGHTRTVEPIWLLAALDMVHLAAAAVWLGGLVLLAASLHERWGGDDAVGAAHLLQRFSRVATFAVLAVAAAGGAMSWVTVRAPRALTSTAYGWTLLAKVLLVLVVVVVAAYNQRRLVPAIVRSAAAGRGPDRYVEGRPVPAGGSGEQAPTASSSRSPAWRRLRTTVTAELVLLMLVLGITGFLVNLRPAAEAAGVTGAFETYVPLTDDLEMNLVVDPNEAGFNSVHLYVLDATGRPSGDIDDVELRLSLPARAIGPIVREPFVAGPGHWQLDGRELSIPGQWLIEAVIGTGRFSEERVEIPVVVN